MVTEKGHIRCDTCVRDISDMRGAYGHEYMSDDSVICPDSALKPDEQRCIAEMPALEDEHLEALGRDFPPPGTGRGPGAGRPAPGDKRTGLTRSHLA